MQYVGGVPADGARSGHSVCVCTQNTQNGIDMTVVVGVSVILGYVGGVPANGARFAHRVSDTCKTGRLVHVHLYVTTPLCGEPFTGEH